MRMLLADEIKKHKLTRIERAIAWGILAIRKELKENNSEWLSSFNFTISENGNNSTFEYDINIPYASLKALPASSFLKNIIEITSDFSLINFSTFEDSHPYDPEASLNLLEIIKIPSLNSLEAFLVWLNQVLISKQNKYFLPKSVGIEYYDIIDEELGERIKMRGSLPFNYEMYVTTDNIVFSLVPNPDIALSVSEDSTELNNQAIIDNNYLIGN